MNNAHRPRRIQRRGVSIPLILALLVVAIVIALLIPAIREPMFAAFACDARVDTGRYVLHPVVTAPFRIEVAEEGRIDSVRSATLTSNVKGTTTIISIVPEG